MSNKVKLSNSREVRMACLLVSLCALSLLASAQVSPASARAVGARPFQKGSPRPLSRAQRKNPTDAQVDRVTKRLDLSEVQRFDLKKLLENDRTESKRLWDDQQIAPIDRMTKLRTLHDNTRKQFRALLTREQQAKYDVILQQAARADAPPQDKGTTAK
ncbi:MAG TPA: hypothetical protein VMT53_11715 [Terriglobales bacterium]|nr:hypothetical protein [Terriglobales bacterium]